MRALLVDDERLARAELRRLLAAHPQIEIIGEAANAAEAKTLIESAAPDLVFLDVQMPGGSGFDLLASLDEAPEVIFTTAFDQYALQAFEVNALDYLQKPIAPARLAAALQKLEPKADAPTATAAPLRAQQKIFIQDGERCWFVALDEIMLFESEGNYTRVYFGQNRPLVLRSLAKLEQRLDAGRFFRTSRQHIANLDFIEGVTPTESGGLALKLADGLRIEISRRRAAEFRERASL